MGYITVGLLGLVFGVILYFAGGDETAGYWAPAEVVGALTLAGGALLIGLGIVTHLVAVGRETGRR